MKQFIKSYHLFLSQPWLRWVMYLIYPVVFVTAFWFLSTVIIRMPLPEDERRIMLTTVLFSLANLITALEIFVDSTIFGGIAAKDANKLEYLKTSARGMPLFQKSLLADGLRRFISLSLIIGGYRLLCPDAMSWVNALSLILILFFYIEAGLIIIRHFPSTPVTIITISVIMVIMTPTISTMLHLASGIQILLPLLTGIAVSVTGRWLIISKVRNSYYDNRNEKSS